MSTLGNVFRSEQSQFGQTLHGVGIGPIEHAGVAEQLVQNCATVRVGSDRRIDRSRDLGEFVVGFGSYQGAGCRTPPLDDPIDRRFGRMVRQ